MVDVPRSSPCSLQPFPGATAGRLARRPSPRRHFLQTSGALATGLTAGLAAGALSAPSALASSLSRSAASEEEWAPDDAPEGVRPIVVQIDNDIRARPSSHLGAARIVYEYTAEGGVTRFSALYTGDQEDVGLIGNVRSARLATIEIVQQFNAILAYHGGATGIQERIWDSWIDFISFELVEHYPFFTRVPWRAAPFNSYTDLPRIRAAATRRALPLTGRGLQTFPVGDYSPPPDGFAPANRVFLPYQSGFEVLYEYDPATNAYWRSMAGRPHWDDGLKAPITTQNVIVQFVPSFLTDIVEDIYGSRSLDYRLLGEGLAWIFRDGYWVEATWHRDDPLHFTTYYDALGQSIALAPGSTWVSLVAPDAPVRVWQE